MSSLRPSQEIAKLIRTEAKKELARRSFWEFCKLLAPEFYKDDRPHLKKLCDVLQAIYEGRMYWSDAANDWYISEVVISGNKPCKKLMINMPPQHGKSRTLFMFCTWVFGKNPAEKIITASYNDTTASDFSRYTRDGISMTKNFPEHIVYSDVFPNTRIKKGHAGFEKWALEGQHFSYLGTGIGGSVTSKGATIQITDDPIKGAKEAKSELVLENTWTWWTSTFASRVAAEGGEPIEIVNMTRWSTKDICGRLLSDPKVRNTWYVLQMEVYDEEKDEMLCPSLMDKPRYLDLKHRMEKNPDIFYANYHQRPIDLTDKVFPRQELQYFNLTPEIEKKFEGSFAYIDVADEGADRVCMVIMKTIGDRIYIVDVVFMHNRNDSALEMCAQKALKHGIKRMVVESNNMGAMFGRSLRAKCRGCTVILLNNSTNKHTRILMYEGSVKRYMVFLDESQWSHDYRLYMNEMYEYDYEEGAEHDDAPDGTTGGMRMMETYYSSRFRNAG